MIRQPVVAGMFYPAQEDRLSVELDSLLGGQVAEEKGIGIVVPHAGYLYSGACAARVYSRVKIPGRVVILGVNHRGTGPSFAVDGHSAWKTPLGECRIDADLRSRLVRESGLFEIDSEAGRQEHSLEVQVPFIQKRNPDASILPVAISAIESEVLVKAGTDLARVLGGSRDVLIVASTDMSHYIPAEAAKKLDRLAIERIEALDPGGLIEVVRNEHISMCGAAPTAVMLAAAKDSGATSARVVEYTHSGEVTGDSREVVAYLGMIIS